MTTGSAVIEPRGFGAIQASLALGLMIGAGLVLWSALLPEYRDPAQASELLTTQDWQRAVDREAFNQDWFRRMAELRTAKWSLQDLGTGLLVLTACFLVITMRYRLATIRDFLSLRSPGSTSGFLIPGTIAWLGMTLSFAYMTIRDVSRHFAPPWADSLSIPLAALPVPFLLLPVPLVVGWLLVRRAPLPVGLWIWDGKRPSRAMIWTALFALTAAILLAALGMAVIAGDIFAIPLTILALYLTLAARAAVIARGAQH